MKKKKKKKKKKDRSLHGCKLARTRCDGDGESDSDDGRFKGKIIPRSDDGGDYD